MSDNNLTQLEKKKQALEIELTRIQSDLDRSIDGVKEDVSNSFAPKTIIRKYPLPIIGAALVLGVLAGRGKKSKSASDEHESEKGVGAVIGREVKNIVTKKSVHFLLDYLEKRISQLKGNNLDKAS